MKLIISLFLVILLILGCIQIGPPQHWRIPKNEIPKAVLDEYDQLARQGWVRLSLCKTTDNEKVYEITNGQNTWRYLERGVIANIGNYTMIDCQIVTEPPITN